MAMRENHHQGQLLVPPGTVAPEAEEPEAGLSATQIQLARAAAAQIVAGPDHAWAADTLLGPIRHDEAERAQRLLRRGDLAGAATAVDRLLAGVANDA